jgi:DmsE family decaheme c-type cytochrome
MAIILILAQAVEKNMKRLHQLVVLCAFMLGVGFGTSVSAATGATKAALDKDAVCTGCHTPVLSIYQTRHGVKADSRTPGCQSCHGESQGHLSQGPGTKPDVVFGAKSKNLSDSDARNGACLSCHEKGVLPRTHWDGSQHASRGVACTNCHTLHEVQDKVMVKTTQAEVCYNCHKSERAQSHYISTHPIAVGKVVCSDCHNTHGSIGPKLLVKNSVNDTCFMCHAEKRGPFLWEHEPVSENCTTCHSAHGSNIAPLLKVRAPFLCQQCHGDHGTTLRSGSTLAVPPGVAPSNTALNAFGNGRMCLNCHSNIHGSNHPAGSTFTR